MNNVKRWRIDEEFGLFYHHTHLLTCYHRRCGTLSVADDKKKRQGQWSSASKLKTVYMRNTGTTFCSRCLNESQRQPTTARLYYRRLSSFLPYGHQASQQPTPQSHCHSLMKACVSHCLLAASQCRSLIDIQFVCISKDVRKLRMLPRFPEMRRICATEQPFQRTVLECTNCNPSCTKIVFSTEMKRRLKRQVSHRQLHWWSSPTVT